MSAYLDGELRERERQKIEDHLKICSSCAQEYEELNQLVAVVKSIDDERLSPEFWPKLVKRLEREKARSPNIFSRMLRHPIPAIAAVILLIAIGFIINDFLLPKQEVVNADYLVEKHILFTASQPFSEEASWVGDILDIETQ